MVKKIKLIVGEDAVTGEMGLKLAGLPDIDWDASMTMEGRLIAHDLLEHVNGVENIGGIGEELQAMGGAWFVRGQFNDVTRSFNYNTAYEHIASDISNMARDYASGESFGTKVPRTYSSEWDSDFEDIINIAKDSAKSDLKDVILCDGKDEAREYKKRLKKYFKAVIHFMRSGIRKATRKYKKATVVNTLFWDIAHAVDAIIPEVDYCGQEFILTIDYRNNRVYCEQYYEYEEVW
jgi:hypothetical protein